MQVTVVEQLEDLLQRVPSNLQQFTGEELITPRAPGKWSRLQILGHLCDSAINNLTRFIQAQHQPEPLVLTPYQQDAWVAAQRYANAPTEDIVALWVSLNRSIVRVISGMPTEIASQTCILPNGENTTVGWLIDDYLQHMKHHLKQIFPDFNE